MSFIKSLMMSVGMFSVFPVPKGSWDDKYMPLIIPNMPIVGLLIGTIWYLTAFLLIKINTPILIACAVIALTPYILSGFLHLDGYMDTADAIFSRRDLEEKRRILKDSNVGAFAVIALLCLFLFQYCAVYTAVSQYKQLGVLIFIPVCSRGITGIALLNLKAMSDKGYGATFKTGTAPVHTFAIAGIVAIACVSSFFFSGYISAMPLLAVIISAICTVFYVYKQMDGISGDLCGCVITVSEFAGMLCASII